MAIKMHILATERGPMDAMRKTALVAGALYLVTIVTSIPALVLYSPVLNDPNYIVGPGPDTGVLWGGFLEMICAFACIGTAVVLYPVVKRHNEAAALGFVAARVLEAAIIVAGIISLLAIVTLRQAATAGADPDSLVTTGNALVAIHNWTFLLGPGFIPAVNALLLGYLLYRTRLVPRVIPALGLIGAPLLLLSATAVLFGLYPQVSVLSAMSAVPIFLWEGSLGLWLVVKGFKPSPLTAATVTPGALTRKPPPGRRPGMRWDGPSG
ncbi:DUF4386 domain-containing protein [Nonomuraea sp. MTCD27]|uniref:DUF4386 domain-containing protein n=1 Tax=Nonomuraea sp. MTCD27 TaxID=1676747 RepID=UPI0035C1F3C0